MSNKCIKIIVVLLLLFGVMLFPITDIKYASTNANLSPFENVKKEKEKTYEQLIKVYQERTVVEILIQDLETKTNLTDLQLKIINRAKDSLERMDFSLQQLMKEFN